MKKRLAIDMDQVICDLLTVWIDRYNNDYGDNLKKEDITEWNWHHLTKPECGKKVYEYLDDQNMFENLPVIEGSQEVVKELSEKYEILIVTAPWNVYNVIPKYKWLKKHFAFIDERNYVFTRNKSLVKADWLIDDKAKNFEGFVGQGLLYDAPHNKNENRYPRMKNWEEIRNYFKSME